MKVKIIYPKEKHYSTLIILHGLNQDILDIMYLVDKISKKKVGVKFIIPIANKMDINWPTGLEKNCSSWYNYFTCYDNFIKHDIIDLSQFESVTKEVVELIKKEAENIDSKYISLVGISQGGTIAINTALKLNIKLKSIYCIDTIFLHTYYKYVNCTKQQFYVLQSEKDEIYNPMYQNYCYGLLKSYNHVVIISVRDNYHCENMDSISSFILKNY